MKYKIEINDRNMIKIMKKDIHIHVHGNRINVLPLNL